GRDHPRVLVHHPAQPQRRQPARTPRPAPCAGGVSRGAPHRLVPGDPHAHRRPVLDLLADPAALNTANHEREALPMLDHAPGPGRRAHRGAARLRTVAVTLFALATLLLAGCAPGGDGRAEAAPAGYVAGDGSLALWTPDQRGEPIDMTGTSYAGESIDL